MQFQETIAGVCFSVDEKNPKFKDIDGDLYTKSGKTLIAASARKDYTGFILPDTVETIGERAFENTNIESINLSSKIKSIKDWAFKHCKLTELVIPQTVQNIGYGIVGYCDELERLDIFTYIEEIPNVIATNCGKLSSVQFPNTVTRIGNGAFEESGLDGFLIPACVRKIGDGAFDKCKSVKFEYYKNISEAEDNSFRDCLIIDQEAREYIRSLNPKALGTSSATASSVSWCWYVYEEQ